MAEERLRFLLDFYSIFYLFNQNSVQVLVLSLIGNPVKIGGGPAAVIGDEHRKKPLSRSPGWEGAVSRMIRKSENLPEPMANPPWTGVGHMIRG